MRTETRRVQESTEPEKVAVDRTGKRETCRRKLETNGTGDSEGRSQGRWMGSFDGFDRCLFADLPDRSMQEVQSLDFESRTSEQREHVPKKSCWANNTSQYCRFSVRWRFLTGDWPLFRFLGAWVLGMSFQYPPSRLLKWPTLGWGRLPTIASLI